MPDHCTTLRSKGLNTTLWNARDGNGWINRSSHQRCSVKKDVLRNFAKLSGKHLRPATLLKKRPCHKCFPVNFAKFLRTPFFAEPRRTTASTQFDIGEISATSFFFTELIIYYSLEELWDMGELWLFFKHPPDIDLKGNSRAGKRLKYT